jgi:hypothetical protein
VRPYVIVTLSKIHSQWVGVLRLSHLFLLFPPWFDDSAKAF